MIRTFADAMGLSRFGVWGYSGGGPYAVACAAALPDRIDAVVVAAGMGQVGVWASVEDFEKTDRQMLGLAVRHPWMARRALSIGALAARRLPKSAMKSFARELSPSDREVLAELGSPAEAMALFTEAFTNGPRGVVDDYAAIARPWECDLSAVAMPVHVMHGSDDTIVPLAHAERLVAVLPEAKLTVWPGEGHLGTIRHVGEILDVFVDPPGQPGE
jgi:pimeloyl-ACP methyl ester carboxylesterase